MRPSAATLVLFAPFVAGGGLVDNPIAASVLVSLDSSDTVEWTASISGGIPSGCSFVNDTDYLPSTWLSEQKGVASAQQCCDMCWSETLCAASVYVAADKTCWLKDDLSGGTTSNTGRVACAKKRGAAPSLTIKASVPGDLITDLQRAGQLGDPLFEKNWLNDTIYHQHNWTYSTHFGLSAATLSAAQQGSGGRVQIVFDGIKMGARVSVNGVFIGEANDQFARYQWTLDPSVHKLRTGEKANVLSVEFDPAIDTGGRFMSCTGGWDWAPYTHTYQRGARIFSKGIWKSVYLAIDQPGGVAITHVVPQLSYCGEYPTERLVDGEHAGFAVGVRVHLDAARAAKGTLTLSPGWAVAGLKAGEVAVRAQLDLPAGESNVTLSVPADAKAVKLWWAAGMGAQPLYNLTVSFQPTTSVEAVESAAVSATRRVGFRYFALVTGNDTDPAFVKSAEGVEGTVSHGMYFRLNGAPVYSKGANMMCANGTPSRPQHLWAAVALAHPRQPVTAEPSLNSCALHPWPQPDGGARRSDGRRRAPRPCQVSGRRRVQHAPRVGRRHVPARRVVRRVRRARADGLSRHAVCPGGPSRGRALRGWVH